MAVTKRSDLIVPEVLEDAIRGEFAGAKALYGSGASFVTPRGFPSNARGGDKITIPYFGTIGEFEDLANNEGGSGAVPALTPAKITMTDEEATVQHSGKAFEITNWSQLAAVYADPYAEAARQMREGLERMADAKLLAQANTSTLVHDIYSSTNAAGSEPEWDELLEARFKFGDEQNDIALMVMHSDVVLRLLQQADTQGRPIWQDVLKSGGLPAEVLGVPVKMSDRATKTPEAGGASTATRYDTLIIKRNALAFWFSGNEPSVQTDRDILADTDVAAIHVYYAAHRYSRVAGGTTTGVVKFRHN